MPTYAYACTTCEHRFEVHQAFSDTSLTDCPECSGRLRKLFNTVGIVFKGSGFYRTDSRSDSRTGESGEGGRSKETVDAGAGSGTNGSSGASSGSESASKGSSSSGGSGSGDSGSNGSGSNGAGSTGAGSKSSASNGAGSKGSGSSGSGSRGSGRADRSGGGAKAAAGSAA